MSRNYEFRPDYSKLYPGIYISPEVMEVLTQSDRKIEYMEYDLKAETFEYDNDKQIARFVPSREDSIQRLEEETKRQFPDEYTAPEERLIKEELIEYLRYSIRQLLPAEQELLDALFFRGLSASEYGEELGVPKSTINSQRLVVISKLRFIMNFTINFRSKTILNG